MSSPHEWNIAFGHEGHAMSILNIEVDMSENKINGYDIPEVGFGFTIEELLEYNTVIQKTNALEEENEILKAEADEYKSFIESELKSVIESIKDDY